MELSVENQCFSANMDGKSVVCMMVFVHVEAKVLNFEWSLEKLASVP